MCISSNCMYVSIREADLGREVRAHADGSMSFNPDFNDVWIQKAIALGDSNNCMRVGNFNRLLVEEQSSIHHPL